MANLVENKKAGLNYEALETYETGLELLGGEVKSLKQKLGSLEGARVLARGGELYLVGMYVPPYQPANADPAYDPYRTRRLLANKKEIAELADRSNERGLTIIPLSVYNKSRFLKVKIAVARGKKKFDKRESLKKKESKRDLARELKDR
ncbi:MAG: SsrA-binding protein [Candidatus Vogelbacteria bacterium CG10_big_fil_rev_8_21_14_0_10_49_38]|uniref:SsrA-binding protein n=1 Tax=Candidatus Vogelbacteria bacterium CG10_big_fil_rev_8_21_14_0_10_49_38 TaxID=1975043 RepID=A0A2H0RIQ2_9BACT|nr:MAG: SsrA-binding protein [bacterium CG10_49_38]PIR46368.1 MAG: SsrA-binding protein [Candidatus Vogelbacteria bacterium CG10_big_fil_rev_8_21_14_0_10_49_38]